MKRTDTRKVKIREVFPFLDDSVSLHHFIDNHGYTGFAGRSVDLSSKESGLVSVTFMKNWGNRDKETSSMGVIPCRNLRELAKEIVRESANGRRFLLTKSPGINVDIEYSDQAGLYKSNGTLYLPLTIEQLERLQEIYRSLIPGYLYNPERDPFKNQPKK